MNKIRAIYFSFILFVSCNSYKDAYVDSPKSILENSMLRLKGEFSNADIHSTSSLYSILFCQKLKSESKCENSNLGAITIIILSENRVKVNYTVNNKIIDSMILKGKYKNGYFSLRRKFNAVGVPFIYYKSKDIKMIIGITDTNDLTLKIRGSKGGGFFLFNNGVPIRENHVFKRMNL